MQQLPPALQSPASAGYVLSAPATPSTPAVSLHSALSPPPPSGSLLCHQLSRLELEAAHLSRQYEHMLSSLADSERQLSGMTVHYVASLQAAVKSSSSSMGILIETHTSLIRKMLIAVQQTAGIDDLEKHIAVTRAALTDLESGVQSLINDDALQSTRAQLQMELQEDTAHNTRNGLRGRTEENEDEAQQQHQTQQPQQQQPPALAAAPSAAASRKPTPPQELQDL